MATLPLVAASLILGLEDRCDATAATTFTYDQLGIGPSSVAPGTVGVPPSYFTRTPSGQLVSLRRGNDTFYYVTDRLGSVMALIGFNARAAVSFMANSYTYDPWGNILTEQEDAAARQPFRFSSAEFDAATALYKMGARYYDPGTGRFTQRDRATVPPSAIYVDNNPTLLTLLIDQNGRDAKPAEAQDEKNECEDIKETGEAVGAVGGGLGGLSLGGGIGLAGLFSGVFTGGIGTVITIALTLGAGGAFIGSKVGTLVGMDIQRTCEKTKNQCTLCEFQDEEVEPIVGNPPKKDK